MVVVAVKSEGRHGRVGTSKATRSRITITTTTTTNERAWMSRVRTHGGGFCLEGRRSNGRKCGGRRQG